MSTHHDKKKVDVYSAWQSSTHSPVFETRIACKNLWPSKFLMSMGAYQSYTLALVEIEAALY